MQVKILKNIKSFGVSLGNPLFTVFFLLCIFTRAKLSDIKLGEYWGDNLYILKGCLIHDLPVFLFFIFLGAFANCFRSLFLFYITKLLQFFIVGFYVLDLLIMHIFGLRLYSADLFKYTLDPGGNSLSFLFVKDPFIVLFVSCWLVFGLLFVGFAKPVRWIPKRIVLAVCFVGFICGFLRVETRAPSDWIVNNLIEVNIPGGVGTDYSREFKEGVLLEKKHLIPPLIRTNGKKETRNIIFLVVEGLSNWQSKAISGLADMTPHIDRIASENVVFKNFYANGFTTEGGLIALFSGELPIPPPWQVTENANFRGFGDELTVPGLLKYSGYWTEFLTTGDLRFTAKDLWLLKIGFDQIEGHESPFYDGLKRIHFNAASDKNLYDRVLTRLRELEGRKYFLVVETVSSHQPFTDPISGELAPIEVPFRYTDEMVGFFYDALKSQGFFDNGLLFIVGDHRSMTPLIPGEYELYGESSTARVPLLIADGGRSGHQVIEKAFQQTDLLPSMMSAFSGFRIDSPFYGDFLTEPLRSPRYILCARGDNRSLVSVFGDNVQTTIKLKGDKTGVVGGEIEEFKFIIDKINYERIVRGEND
jgi:hypothetical protein